MMEIPCPHCGKYGHRQLSYNGMPLLACPECPENEIKGYAYDASYRDKTIYREWYCLECGDKGLGGMNELFLHMQSHIIDSNWDEAANYFGE